MNLDDNIEERHNQDERRYQQFVIPASFLYSLLIQKPGEPLQLPSLENLTDWKILNIHFSPSRFAFIVTIFHQSFASIPLGDPLPFTPITLKLFTVEPFPLITPNQTPFNFHPHPTTATFSVPLNPPAVNPAFINPSTKSLKI